MFEACWAAIFKNPHKFVFQDEFVDVEGKISMFSNINFIRELSEYDANVLLPSIETVIYLLFCSYAVFCMNLHFPQTTLKRFPRKTLTRMTFKNCQDNIAHETLPLGWRDNEQFTAYHRYLLNWHELVLIIGQLYDTPATSDDDELN